MLKSTDVGDEGERSRRVLSQTTSRAVETNKIQENSVDGERRETDGSVHPGKAIEIQGTLSS